MKPLDPILLQIATELGARPAQVKSAVDLLDGGASVPFIARYRKEATDGLDDNQLRELEARLAYLRELQERRGAVLKSIDEQGKLTPGLRAAIESASTKQVLEDLYLPFKPKRRSKGLIAREAGIEPLADRLFADPALDPAGEAAAFVNVEASFADVPAVLDGVRDILSERWAEDAVLVGRLRDWLWAEGRLRARLLPGKDPNAVEVAKFLDYFDFDEAIRSVPSHRALAVFRARALDILEARLVPPDEAEAGAAAPRCRPPKAASPSTWAGAMRAAPATTCCAAASPGPGRSSSCSAWSATCSAACARRPKPSAIKVFADNLRDLLLAAPAGRRAVMGLDPGIRTGVKVAVVSDTGKVLDTATVYPHEPRRDWDGALHTLGRLVAAHGVELVAIGNGTASRETDTLAADLLHRVGRRGSAADAAEGGGQRSRRLGVLGQRIRQQGAAGAGRQPARRGQHRAPAAGPAGRAGEDRSARASASAEYQHDVNPGALARATRYGGGRLRQRRRRGPEHRLSAVVGACVGAEPGGGGERSCAGAMRHGAFRRRRQLLDVAGLGRRPSSRPRVSCASATATTRST